MYILMKHIYQVSFYNLRKIRALHVRIIDCVISWQLLCIFDVNKEFVFVFNSKYIAVVYLSQSYLSKNAFVCRFVRLRLYFKSSNCAFEFLQMSISCTCLRSKSTKFLSTIYENFDAAYFNYIFDEISRRNVMKMIAVFYQCRLVFIIVMHVYLQ